MNKRGDKMVKKDKRVFAKIFSMPMAIKMTGHRDKILSQTAQGT
jgi:hypothetical protein